MRVVPIPILADNYLFALTETGAGGAVLVDPGEAAPALEWLKRQELTVEAILVTHHHGDHTRGLPTLVRCFPGARVIGPSRNTGRIEELNESVRQDDRIRILGHEALVLEVPGHTLDHVAYFVPRGAGGDLFSGDTIFGGTIGNLFEGTPDMMYGSLVKIRALPSATRIWCAHEYTLQFVREAARFDPGNARLAERLRCLEATAGTPTVPLTLEEERATNPFLRWDDPDLLKRLATPAGLPAFRRLCELL